MLFRWSVYITNYTEPLHTKFKIIFGKQMSTQHAIKSATVDIQLLINAIAAGSIIRC